MVLPEHRFSLVFSLTSIHCTVHYLACPNLASYHLDMVYAFLLASNFNRSQRKDHHSLCSWWHCFKLRSTSEGWGSGTFYTGTFTLVKTQASVLCRISGQLDITNRSLRSLQIFCNKLTQASLRLSSKRFCCCLIQILLTPIVLPTAVPLFLLVLLLPPVPFDFSHHTLLVSSFRTKVFCCVCFHSSLHSMI